MFQERPPGDKITQELKKVELCRGPKVRADTPAAEALTFTGRWRRRRVNLVRMDEAQLVSPSSIKGAC